MQAAIQKLLSKNQVILEKAKKKLKDEGTKSVLKYRNKLPTPDTLKDKFSTQLVCTQSTVNRTEKNYKKLKNFTKKVQKALEKSKKALEKLQALVNKVLSIIAKIAALIATVDVLINILQKKC